MSRKEELLSILDSVDEEQQTILKKLVDEIVFLEERMAELKELPFIRVHPEKKAKQEATVAAKQYKEMSQSYMNGIRILSSVVRHEGEGIDVDPVQEFLKSYGKQ
ncbi:MAG: hypothetical protein IJ883_00060 [Eubacterium sp.]|nr:hypothetical protein [Eubacterium sp.]